LWGYALDPVESPFSAVRLRTDAARRYKKVANTEALIWKILAIAEKKFQRLKSPELFEDIYAEKKFVGAHLLT
jgi:putative transposase